MFVPVHEDVTLVILFVLVGESVVGRGNENAYYREGDPCMKNGMCLQVRTCYGTSRMPKEEREHYLKGCAGEEKNASLICCPNSWHTVFKRDISTADNELASPPNCGTTIFDASIDDRIVGGDDAKPGAWPWTVALGVRNKNNRIDWHCGGTLISSSWVLTAAHCYFVEDLSMNWVRLGSTNLAKTEETSVDLKVKQFIVHENYTQKGLHNDIALIELQRAVTFTSHIRPVCLPMEGEVSRSQYEDEFAYVVGWGLTSYTGVASSILQQVQIPVVNRSSCAEVYRTKRTRIVDDQLCAGSLEGDKDTCQGDSGGPLVIFDTSTNSFFIIGVVSFGYRCASPGFPGVYTKVSNYIEWIQDTVNKNST